LLAVERCSRYCVADDPERVCDHVVGVDQDTNDAGGIATAHHDCVVALKKLHDADLGRWSCTVRCMVGATGKGETTACVEKCGGKKSTTGDAGVDAGDAAVKPKDPFGIE